MNWNIIDNKLCRQIQVKNFAEIIDKLQAVAIVADKLNHHPDFRVYGYNKIEFALYSHENNNVTNVDYELANEIDVIFKTA